MLKKAFRLDHFQLWRIPWVWNRAICKLPLVLARRFVKFILRRSVFATSFKEREKVKESLNIEFYNLFVGRSWRTKPSLHGNGKWDSGRLEYKLSFILSLSLMKLPSLNFLECSIILIWSEVTYLLRCFYCCIIWTYGNNEKTNMMALRYMFFS